MDETTETPQTTLAGLTPADLLRHIAESAGSPWFPSDYARKSGVPRDDLDEPLNELRNAELVKVVDWIKGRGQGYGLTPSGEKAAGDPGVLVRSLAIDHPPPPPADVPVAHPELPPAKTRDLGGLTTFDRGELARQALYSPRPPVITPVLILANLIWFAVGIVVAWRMGGAVGAYLRGWDNGVLSRIGGVYGDALLHGEWWLLITACFAHSGGLHLLLNLYALGVIGPVAEGLWGRWRFALIYATSGFAGSCLAMAVNPDSLVVGASGAVWGVMTAVLAWLVLNREHLPPEVVLDWMRMLGLVLIVNLAVSFAPRVSWEAHLGGAAVGFAVAILANVVRPGLVRRRILLPAALALGLIPVACLSGLMIYSTTSDTWQPIRDRDASRQRVQFFVAARKVLDPIDKDVVHATFRDAGVRVAAGSKPNETFRQRLSDLQTQAEATGEELGRIRTTGSVGDRMQSRAVDYSRAVAAFAAALQAAFAGPGSPADAWGPVVAARKTADERWDALIKP